MIKIIFLAICFSLSSPSMAATIELAFTGVITTTSNDPGVTPLFHPGDPWRLTLTYDHPHLPDLVQVELAHYFVSGGVHLTVNHLQFTDGSFGVTVERPGAINLGGSAALSGVPGSSVGYQLTFGSANPFANPLILDTQTTSLPASFADWNFPAAEHFQLLTGSQGWSARSTAPPATTIRVVPEPAALLWATACVWWMRRRRRS
jgi:hypothetical protein